jgi:hypothetical protein
MQAYPTAAHSGCAYRPSGKQKCWISIVFSLPCSDTALTIAPQGLTNVDLMGELANLLALPAYQLVLPFTQEAWRALEYAHILAGTT